MDTEYLYKTLCITSTAILSVNSGKTKCNILNNTKKLFGCDIKDINKSDQRQCWLWLANNW